MKISTKGRYALRVMIDLATHDNGKYISLKEIAGRQEISNKYLEQIISLLNKAGYLETAISKYGLIIGVKNQKIILLEIY